MPPKAFQCPHDSDSWATLEDCQACRTRCAPMPLMRALWQDEIEDDGYHADPKVISVTQVLGCIRKAYLTATLEFAEEPLRFLARWIGSTIHARLERTAVASEKTETTYRMDLGDGFSFAGTVDHEDAEAIRDWKFTSYVPKEPRPDNVRQLQIYRQLAKAKVPPEVCYIGTKDVQNFLLDLKDDDEDLDWALARAAVLKTALMGELAPEQLPPEGRDIQYGRDKTACDYCPVREQCEAMGGGEDA